MLKQNPAFENKGGVFAYWSGYFSPMEAMLLPEKVSPFPRGERGSFYPFPISFIHLGYLFLANSTGTVPYTMIRKVPGLANVPR